MSLMKSKYLISSFFIILSLLYSTAIAYKGETVQGKVMQVKDGDTVVSQPEEGGQFCAPFAGWQTVRGIQITGIAEIGRQGSIVYEEGLDAFNKRKGTIGTVPDIMSVIKVKPSKIEYIDTALGNKGFKVRHILVC